MPLLDSVSSRRLPCSSRRPRWLRYLGQAFARSVDVRLRGPDCYACVPTHRAGHPLGRVACPYSRQIAVRSRLRQRTVQAAEPVQQRDRSFPDPAVQARDGAVRGAAPAADRRDQLGHVVAVAAGGDRRERDTVRLDHQVMPAAGPAPVHRGRTGGRPALHRADAAGVDRCAGEVQQACRPQLGQQQLVQALPYPGLVPVPQPSPAGHRLDPGSHPRRPAPTRTDTSSERGVGGCCTVRPVSGARS
jgi:hypothetical protein